MRLSDSNVETNKKMNCLKVGNAAFIKSNYMLETPGISEYRKVIISDRSGQSAGNPLKASDILEGKIKRRN